MIYFCGNAEKARMRRAAGGDRPGDFLIFYGAAAFGGPALLMGRRAYAIIKANRYSEIKKCRNGDGMGGMKIIKGMGKLLSRLAGCLAALWRQRQRLNQWMARRYTSAMLALIGTAVCLAVAVYALLVSPCLGVANDSIGNQKMSEYGLSYREADRGEDPARFSSNEYFTRAYETARTGEPIHSSQNLFVRAAMALDAVVTSDGLFDVRFLALVYLALYLPAVYLVLKAGLERVRYFSEAVAVTALGVLIFADISYLVLFNSLYSDGLILICLLYIAGASMSLQREGRGQTAFQLVLAAAGMVLCLLEKRFFLAGILVAVLLVAQVRIMGGPGRIVAGALAALMLGTAVFSLYWGGQEFDDTSKLHSVTRGVLLQSRNPDRTLEELGIDASYSLLTDQSLYDYYPPSEISNPVLQHGFLDRYDALDVAVYYGRHPGDLVMMLNNAVSSALRLRRDYCGNYERSAGMPAMARSVSFSAWSMFKERSLPSTIGYLVLLIIAFAAMSGPKVFNRKAVHRWDYAYFSTMLAVTAIGVADITAVICLSGDAQLAQCSMTFGVTLDLLLYFVVAEILHKLNILEGKNEKA